MKKVLYRLVWVPLGALLVVFFVANREPVAVSLDPLSTDSPALATPALPLWVWLVFSTLFGFALGALGMWTSARPARIKARAEHRELLALKNDQAARPRLGDPPPTLEAR